MERTREANYQRDRTKAAGLLGGFRAMDEYRPEKFIPSENNAAAFEASKAFNAETENLYFFGPTGSGKSHLATIAARLSFKRNDWKTELETITPMEISRTIRSCERATEEAAVIGTYAGMRVLVIEDIGVAKDTEFLISAMYEIINARYQNSVGGLIVTSNLSLGELAQKLGDDRISSRLAQMCRIFNLAGERDHRLPQRKT